MKIVFLFLVFGLNIAYSNDSLYVISSTITNLDSLRDIQQQNIEWDSITTSTNHFVGENDSWYLLKVIGNESSGSFNVDTITVDDWKDNYYTFFQTIIDTTQSNIPPYDTLFEAIDYYQQTDTIPIIMFISEINSFCKEAIDDSTIYLDSNNIFVINTSSTTTKYCKEVVFMSTPSFDKYFGNVFNFIWTDVFYTINDYEDVDSVFFNFDDDNGFVHLPKDSLYLVIYETPGVKTITTKVKFTNSNELISYSGIYVDGIYLNQTVLPNSGNRLNVFEHYTLREGPTWDKKIELHETVSKTIIKWRTPPVGPPYNPIPGFENVLIEVPSIEAYVYYGCGNNDFDKPFIIIEGIDQLNQMFPWTEYKKSKEWDFKEEECRNIKKIGLIEILEEQSKEEPNSSDEIGIFSKLIQDGYDVVIVNHGDGGRPVKENGELFAELMKKINDEKTGDNKSIVMGASMGGLTGRIGLALLEQEEPEAYDHQVSHFISVDSPHRGALINAATQLHLQVSALHYKIKENTKSELNRLNSDASKDLLIHYFSNNINDYLKTGTKRNWSYKVKIDEAFYLIDISTSDLSGLTINKRKEFQDYLDVLGYPEKLVKIAVSNGSFSNSNQNINLSNWLFNTEVTDVGSEVDFVIFDVTARSDFFFKLGSFPAFDETKTLVDSRYDLASPIYDISIDINLTNNDHNLNFSLDNIAGGNIPLIKEFEGKFLTYDHCTYQMTESDITTSQRVSTFIPTASSIDLRMNSNFELDHQYQFFNDNIEDLLNGDVENVEVYTPFDFIYGLEDN